MSARYSATVLARFALAGMVLALVMALVATETPAKLHTGTASMFPGDGYDFSDSLITGSELDFIYIVTAREASANGFEDVFLMLTPAVILWVGNADSTYSTLLSAPTNELLYGDSEYAFTNDVFVVKTREGHYAKMRIAGFGSRLEFEYTYQDDGSPSFEPTTAVRKVTWGGIKALYR